MIDAPQRKVVLVTGAAGGLGRTLVEQFEQNGWNVAAGQHTTQLAASSPNILPINLDVTDVDQIEHAVASVLERWGRIDALINNAGVTEDQLVARMTEAAWDRVLDINLNGAFRISQAVIRPMMKQRDGHILNISSHSALHGAQGQAAYAAAKAGLIGLTQSLAKEVASRNVRVNAILPGVLPTSMTASLPPEIMRSFARANALGRINDIDEVARFVVFLAEMRNVSGQVFQLDSRIGRWC